jgi:hypothetical protein
MTEKFLKWAGDYIDMVLLKNYKFNDVIKIRINRIWFGEINRKNIGKILDVLGYNKEYDITIKRYFVYFKFKKEEIKKEEPQKEKLPIKKKLDI